MKFTTRSIFASFSVVLIALLAGCEKKEAATPAPAPETTVVVQQEQPQATAAPVAPTPVAPDARLAESQAAMKARDYEKAAAALVAMQRARLNEQQAAAAAAQMRQLQRSLADAVASGDPSAIAAANRLRQMGH
jgi:hypothetical protein